MMQLTEISARLNALPLDERQRIIAQCAQLTARYRWKPNVGPQTEAYFSPATEILYGGEVGGGKSELLCGLALNEHKNSLILRRIGEDVKELAGRFLEIVGSAEDFSKSPPTFDDGRRLVMFRGCETDKAKLRYKGKPKDLYGFDELADFLESQYLYIIQWLRSVDVNQRCRIVATTNGVHSAEGGWIIRRWAPWLDPAHPKPAASGEIRWFCRGRNDIDFEVDGPGYHKIDGRPRPVLAVSRTFIRAKLSDNPDLERTGYGDRVDSMSTEDNRRAYREGDFTVGLRDARRQVIPTAWIEAAQARWRPQPPKGSRMTAQAVDIAQGGGDLTVLASRYGGWYAPLVCAPGIETKTGKDVLLIVVQHRRNRCPVVIDLGGGWGGDAAIAMAEQGIDSFAFNGVKASIAKTRDHKLGFLNQRAEAWWRLREELDPDQEGGSIVELPPDALLKADLAAPLFEVTRQGIQIETKDDIKDRLGRSPDRGDAVVMCAAPGDKAARTMVRRGQDGGGRPAQANVGYAAMKAKLGQSQ
jgi:hypothetical protein